MAKDSAEKGLSEEAVKLFDLAKVHVHFICGHEFTYKFMILCFFIFFYATESWWSPGDPEQTS